MLNLKQLIKITDLCLIAIGVLLGFEILFHHSAVTNWMEYVVVSAGVWGWVVLGVIQFLQVVIIPVPASFITLLSMKMYPDSLFWLFVVTMSVTLAGVIVTYLIGLKWGKKAVMWCAGSEDEYNKWLKVLKCKKTNVFYLVTIIFPVFPDDMLCLLAGSIKMNFWWYLFANTIGRAIGLLTFMVVFKTMSNGIITMIIMFVLLVALFIIRFILKRRFSNESSSDR